MNTPALPKRVRGIIPPIVTPLKSRDELKEEQCVPPYHIPYRIINNS